MIRIATAPVSPSRAYQYDTLGRPTSRTLARQGATRNDAFTYNDRSELISDVVDGTGLNGWDYDNIGNRLVQQQGSACDTYTSNALNQYTAIEDESHDVFTPTYDDDGNQTRIKTSTGIWNVTYNAKNRPLLFSKEGENLTVACTYDYMGRRATKVVTENGQITSSHRFLYRGYLQIACCDRKRSTHPCLWLITWDPTQPIATRPLAIQKDSTWYTYGWDLTKNIWEAYTTTGYTTTGYTTTGYTTTGYTTTGYTTTGYIGTAYTYTAYGQVTASGSITQPIQWSSVYNDTELGLVYYNYRHFDPTAGRWLGRDFLDETYARNRYTYINNKNVYKIDALGLYTYAIFYYQKEGETSFYRAALTLERDIKNRNTFNEKCDTVRLIAIRFVDDFNKEWERLKELSESCEQSKIQELHILTHSGKGEIYLNGFSLSSHDISDLEKLNWTNNNSEIVLHGCNSGLCDSSGESVAGAFHDSQQVTAIGQSGYAQFSESENSRMPWDRIDDESEDVYLWSYGDGGPDFTYGLKREPIIYK